MTLHGDAEPGGDATPPRKRYRGASPAGDRAEPAGAGAGAGEGLHDASTAPEQPDRAGRGAEPGGSARDWRQLDQSLMADVPEDAFESIQHLLPRLRTSCSPPADGEAELLAPAAALATPPTPSHRGAAARAAAAAACASTLRMSPQPDGQLLCEFELRNMGPAPLFVRSLEYGLRPVAPACTVHAEAGAAHGAAAGPGPRGAAPGPPPEASFSLPVNTTLPAERDAQVVVSSLLPGRVGVADGAGAEAGLVSRYRWDVRPIDDPEPGAPAGAPRSASTQPRAALEPAGAAHDAPSPPSGASGGSGEQLSNLDSS